jgi:hypothetical protein
VRVEREERGRGAVHRQVVWRVKGNRERECKMGEVVSMAGMAILQIFQFFGFLDQPSNV